MSALDQATLNLEVSASAVREIAKHGTANEQALAQAWLHMGEFVTIALRGVVHDTAAAIHKARLGVTK